MQRSAPGVVVDLAELSDPGRDPDKQANEDSLATAATPLGFLAVVCDGVGGHAGGREASQTAVATILADVEQSSAESAPALVLQNAVRAACRAVYAQGGSLSAAARPGSTSVVVLVGSQGTTVAHVGDSRAYRFRNGKVERLTRDHSVVQQLLDEGRLSPEQAEGHPEANRITRALGVAPDVLVDVQHEATPANVADVFLLCTDGLTDLVIDDELLAAIEEHPNEPASAAKQLVDLANARGGHDNITVQVFRVLQMHPSQRPKPAPTIDDSAAPPHKTSGFTQPWIPGTARTIPDQGAPVEPPSLRPARSPAWPLVLFVIGVFVLGVLLGGVGLWWWLAHGSRDSSELSSSFGEVPALEERASAVFPEARRFDRSSKAR